jgi:hypothetical protein
MELKAQIKDQLLKNKKEELQKEIDLNKNLKEVNCYYLFEQKDTTVENFVKELKDQGIKLNTLDISKHPHVLHVVGMRTRLVLEVNDEFIVLGREFSNPRIAIQILRNLAHPDFVMPPYNVRIIEALKNLNFNINKRFSNVNQQLLPITKLMGDISKDYEEERKANTKKEKKGA